MGEREHSFEAAKLNLVRFTLGTGVFVFLSPCPLLETPVLPDSDAIVLPFRVAGQQRKSSPSSSVLPSQWMHSEMFLKVSQVPFDGASPPVTHRDASSRQSSSSQKGGNRFSPPESAATLGTERRRRRRRRREHSSMLFLSTIAPGLSSS